MVEEGCLEGIDEVYGYHNIPLFDEGDIRVCSGGFFAWDIVVTITIHGQGGDASVPHLVRDPITAASMLHASLSSIRARNIDSSKNIVFTICSIKSSGSGSDPGVYPDKCTMEGTIRSYDDELNK